MKQSGYLKVNQEIELKKGPGLTIWGYNKQGEFVCRLEINATGLEVFTGKKGGRKIADVYWEDLVKKLQP